MDDLRDKTSLKRLQIEKKLADDTQKYETQIEKLTKENEELLQKTEHDGKLINKQGKQSEVLQSDFQQLSKLNNDAEEELKHLRQVRIELTNEREQLVGDIKGHRVEIESVYRLNKEFRAKIKRLESLLYGKNIANNKFK